MTKLADLDFPLPENLIARHPAEQRSSSRLLGVQCGGQTWAHQKFIDLPHHLRRGDLLVINDTKVVPARLIFLKDGGGKVEGLWLKNCNQESAEFLLAGNRLRPGMNLRIEGDDDGVLAKGKTTEFEVQGEASPGHWILAKTRNQDWASLLELHGLPPLPPYIRSQRRAAGEDAQSDQDRERYQTVWASQAGAVAAPTAGLHFDAALLQKLQDNEIETVSLTLHVGEGTFRPVIAEHLEDHVMHSESYAIPEASLQALAKARKEKRRVVAVGTTVCRALEAFAQSGLARGDTAIFIQPGFPFQIVDVLLTNFHTPKSTLLALVAGFADHCGAKDGLAFVKKVYADAVAEKYRFFSYGDASLWEC